MVRFRKLIGMADISWRKGFFRLWCVGSILWSFAVIILTSSNFINPYVKAQSLTAIEPLDKDTGKYVESGPRSISQKKDGHAQIIEFEGFPGWEIYIPINQDEKDILAIAEKTVQQIRDYIGDEKYKKRIEYIKSTAFIISIPVSFFLILGIMIYWVFRGFADSRNR